MVAGTWLNQDGLYLQFGTQKPVPDVAGEYMTYGNTREIESFIALAPTQFGGSASGMFVSIAGVPNGFSGTTTAAAAGIQSLQEFFPLQQTTPVTTSNVTGGGILISAPQIYVDQVEYECLITANAGTGGATGINVGLAYATEQGASSVFAQVAPNAGVQFGVLSNAAMTAGATFTFRPNTNNAAGTGGAGYLQYATANTATITGPATGWIGNLVPTTSFLNGVSGTLANAAYLSVTATGGTYSGTAAAGLMKVRIRYTTYGAINQ